MGRGNVHSGATPPWLMPDSSGDGGRGTSVLVGPSEEEFLKHSKGEGCSYTATFCTLVYTLF